MDDRNQVRDQNEPQVRNPNFRRQQGPSVPQVMQRGQRNSNDQRIRSPFQENLVDEEFTEQPKDHIHHFRNYEAGESRTFLTKDKHDEFLSGEREEGNENVVAGESN